MWAIHNPIKGWTLYSLSERELGLIVQTLSPNEFRLAYVAQKGAAAWLPLSQKECSMPTQENSKNYPDLERIQTKDDTNSEAIADFFIFKPQRTSNARLHDRYEAVLPVSIEGNNGQIFNTNTVNLSEGGIYFSEIIPEWVSGYFIVKIQTDKESFQLICSLVEDQKEKHRVQIMSEENDPNYKKFQSWLSASVFPKLA